MITLISASSGKYSLIDELDRSGFATVYRARDSELGRDVALKVLDPLLTRDSVWPTRFQREARAIASLDQPRIVTIYEIGQIRSKPPTYAWAIPLMPAISPDAVVVDLQTEEVPMCLRRHRQGPRGGNPREMPTYTCSRSYSSTADRVIIVVSCGVGLLGPVRVYRRTRAP